MIVEKGKRELFSFSFNITHGIHDAGRILYLIIPLTSHFHYKKMLEKTFASIIGTRVNIHLLQQH